MEKIRMMSDETGEELEFFVLEQTKLNGVSYILVTDSEFGDAECMILKDKAGAENTDSIYGVRCDGQGNGVYKADREHLKASCARGIF